jgi:hypothetical protein
VDRGAAVPMFEAIFVHDQFGIGGGANYYLCKFSDIKAFTNFFFPLKCDACDAKHEAVQVCILEFHNA